MNILEHEIEDLVWNAIDSFEHDLLQKRGLPVSMDFNYVRQYDLGKYGRADIIGFKANPSFVAKGKKHRVIDVQIIELKRDKVNFETLLQAVRYAKGIQHKSYLTKLRYQYNFSYILIGKCLDLNTDLCYMPDVLPDVQIYTYALSITEGLKFKQEKNFSLSHPNLDSNDTDLKDILLENVQERVMHVRDSLHFNRWHEERERRIALGELVPDEENDLPF